jgi:hypothetical protein
MHNQKTALLVYTLALASVIHRVHHNLIVCLPAYQDFEGDGGILLANGSRLSLHINRNPGFKMGLLFEYMHDTITNKSRINQYFVPP